MMIVRGVWVVWISVKVGFLLKFYELGCGFGFVLWGWFDVVDYVVMCLVFFWVWNVGRISEVGL